MKNLAAMIEKSKLVVIIRRIYGDDLMKLANTLASAGIQFMEVTFDQADPDCVRKTTDSIKALRAELGDALHFGAGTVLTEEQLNAAHQAGAEFIISPNTDLSIIQKTKQLGLVSVPGAMSPSEMVAAQQAGGDIIKVFPFKQLGIPFMKDVIAPLSHIKFMATGGVTEDNLAEIFQAGLCSAGIGGSLSDKSLIRQDRFDVLKDRAKRMIEIANVAQDR